MPFFFRALLGAALLLLHGAPAWSTPYAYVSNAATNSVAVLDTSTNRIVASVPVGLTPGAVAVSPSGARVYVANVAGESVSVIDADARAVVATVDLRWRPAGLAVDPSGTRVYVATTDGLVFAVDAATNAIAGTFDVWATVTGLAADPRAPRLYAALLYADAIAILDTTTFEQVGAVPVGGRPWGLAVDPVRPRLYVGNGASDTLSVIDTTTGAVVETVAVGPTPSGVAVDPAGTRIYVADLAGGVVVVDAASLAVMDRVRVGRSPLGVAVTPSGARVLVANADSGTVSVIDTATNAVLTSIVVGGAPMAYGLFAGPDTQSSAAVEYRNTAFGHYFVTSGAAEIAALDSGAIGGWVRTGATFLVRTAGSPRAADVCRYWTGSTYAPQSSHFLSPFAAECAKLAATPGWRNEGIVFSILPSDAAGVCAPGTTPLTRLYNNATGGVPNHRYTTSADVRRVMVAQGWTPEGAFGVIGCVPDR